MERLEIYRKAVRTLTFDPPWIHASDTHVERYRSIIAEHPTGYFPELSSLNWFGSRNLCTVALLFLSCRVQVIRICVDEEELPERIDADMHSLAQFLQVVATHDYPLLTAIHLRRVSAQDGLQSVLQAIDAFRILGRPLAFHLEFSITDITAPDFRSLMLLSNLVTLDMPSTWSQHLHAVDGRVLPAIQTLISHESNPVDAHRLVPAIHGSLEHLSLRFAGLGSDAQAAQPAAMFDTMMQGISRHPRLKELELEVNVALPPECAALTATLAPCLLLRLLHIHTDHPFEDPPRQTLILPLLPELVDLCLWRTRGAGDGRLCIPFLSITAIHSLLACTPKLVRLVVDIHIDRIPQHPPGWKRNASLLVIDAGRSRIDLGVDVGLVSGFIGGLSIRVPLIMDLWTSHQRTNVQSPSYVPWQRQQWKGVRSLLRELSRARGTEIPRMEEVKRHL